MLVITNRLPLNTLYPKPEEKCGLLRGNRDSNPPQLPEISKLLYQKKFMINPKNQELLIL